MNSNKSSETKTQQRWQWKLRQQEIETIGWLTVSSAEIVCALGTIGNLEREKKMKKSFREYEECLKDSKVVQLIKSSSDLWKAGGKFYKNFKNKEEIPFNKRCLLKMRSKIFKNNF